MRNYDAKNWLFYIWMNWIRHGSGGKWQNFEFILKVEQIGC